MTPIRASCHKFMVYSSWVFILLLRKPVSCQQPYDQTPCQSTGLPPGSRYACTSPPKSCPTFVVYRSRPGLQTISAVAGLLRANETELLLLNNLETSSQILDIGTDILVPVTCSCSGEFFLSNLSYTVTERTSFEEIACGVFEGLLKKEALAQANPDDGGGPHVGDKLDVPLKCACPEGGNGVQYLVTYSLVQGDAAEELGRKFGVAANDIVAANNLRVREAVFPNTTLLVPLTRNPVISRSAASDNAQAPVFLPITMGSNGGPEQSAKLYVIGGVILAILVVGVLAAGGVYVNVRTRLTEKKSVDSKARRSPNLQLLGDFRIRMSMLKYSLHNYSFEEMRQATRNFSEETRMGSSAYKGRIGDFDVIIKRMKSEDCHRIIGIYSKINHVNIVDLLGACHGDADLFWSFLVYEFAGNGSLRDCLSNPLNILQWNKRTQIAFDIAMGLHYLHHCTALSYIHMNINSSNILVTGQWRAKLANFGAESVGDKGEMVMSIGGWTAPEHFLDGMVSPKLDIYGFGVVLLELLSGKSYADRKFVKEALGCLGGGCFDELRSLMDPRLQEDYPPGEALCLSTLAKSCLEDNPRNRPSMNDILKVLARVVR